LVDPDADVRVPTPVGDDSARDRLGAALRRLGHAVVGHQADADHLEALAGVAEGWADTVAAGPARHRRVEDYHREIARPTPPDGGAIEHFHDCPVSGPANPLAIGLEAVRDGDQIRAVTTLGAAHEGAPGRAHGGIVAAIFDDAMGFVITMLGVEAYQGELTIRYVEPTPVHEELHVRAWPIDHTGRKLLVAAEIVAGGTCTARAQGLHVVARPR
jgi:acyl-coenzyme A thioesterase PaaI-like protein